MKPALQDPSLDPFARMFCPRCKSEYRQGFYRCADCGVDLVSALPPEPDPPPPETDDAGADSIVLCQEDNPARLTAILSALQGREITYYDYPIHDPKAGLSQTFPRRLNVGQAYEIRVAKFDLLAAQEVLAEILDEERDLAEAPAPQDDSEGGAKPADDQVPETWNAAQAIAEVWSGEDGGLAQFLTDTLRENGIPSRREKGGSDPERVHIFVSPEMLPRAREIVREVVEGTAPG